MADGSLSASDLDFLTEMAMSDPEVGGILRGRGIMSPSNARKLDMAFAEHARRKPSAAPKIQFVRRLLAAPSPAMGGLPLIGSSHGHVSWDDVDTLSQVFPAGASTFTLTGARGKNPWVFASFRFNGPIGFILSSLKNNTVDSVDLPNIAGQTINGFDLQDFASNSPLWLTPNARPRFQFLPYGTILSGITPVEFTVYNATGGPAYAVFEVLKWTPDPCNRGTISMPDGKAFVYPDQRGYAKAVGNVFEGKRRMVFNALRNMGVGGWEDEASELDLYSDD